MTTSFDMPQIQDEVFDLTLTSIFDMVSFSITLNIIYKNIDAKKFCSI